MKAFLHKLISTKAIAILIPFISLISTGYAQQMGYGENDIDGIKPFRISSGDNVVKIGTIVSSFVDLRQYPAGAVQDFTKNTIKLKDARLDVKGKVGDDYEYHLQMDFAAWGATYMPGNSFVDDANVTYKGFRKLFNIRVGYGKIPFSLNSLVEHYQSNYWERPEVSKGDFFSRRDLGITLTRQFWDNRIKAAVGVYTGTGEAALGGTNDASGAFEYVGRIEFSYPEAHNEEIIDTKGLTTPNFSIGLNARYTKRDIGTSANGASFLPGEQGAMLNSSDSLVEVKVINGEKYILGADISILYRGFSAQLETDNMRAKPLNPNDPLLQGKGALTNYIKSGGWYATLNYFAKPIKSIFSVRYDEMNANDLVAGISSHWSAGISYQLKGFNSMIKAEFDQNLQQQSNLKYGNESINTNKWHNAFKLGWQLVID